MEHWWIGWQMSKFRQKQLLQEAARFRLLLDGEKREKRSRWMHRDSGRQRAGAHRQPLPVTLHGNLGRRLIDWGTILRQRRNLTRNDGIRAERG